VKHHRISFADAMSAIEAAVGPGPCEIVPIVAANKRILAEPLVAARDFPPAALSAMDGYAIEQSCISGPAGRLLDIGKPQYAGDPTSLLRPGEARPIFTGACVPENAGAVLILERADFSGKRLRLSEDLLPNSNIRLRGEDARRGERVVEAGRRINPAMIGALCNYGVAELSVRKAPRVAIMVLGDELTSVAEATGDAIIDANGPMVAAMLADAGCVISHCVRVGDDASAIVGALERFVADGADFVVSSGGASVGERDLLRSAVDALETHVGFHGVHMRPGKPVLFAMHASGTPIFGLPGNPVAALVATRFFVMAAVRAWYGLQAERALLIRSDEVTAGPTRVLKAHTRNLESGIEVAILPGQQSHMLRPTLSSNAWKITGGGIPSRVFPLFDSLA